MLPRRLVVASFKCSPTAEIKRRRVTENDDHGGYVNVLPKQRDLEG
jgi:hypothetical protein